MKILITYAPSEQQFLPVPPLGISVLSKHLEEHGIANDIMDLELELWLALGERSSEFASEPIENLKPDLLPVDCIIDRLLTYEIIAFSVMGKRQVPYVISIVQKIKEKSKTLKHVILGGAFFTEKNAKEIISTYAEYIDFVIVGEGWFPLTELCKRLNQGEEIIGDISGICFINKAGSLVYKEGIKWNGDLPIPDYSNINKIGYIKQQETLYGIRDHNIVYHVLVGDRHCPYRCSFCRISENTKKVKEPEEIADEMIKLYQVSGACNFSLVCNEMNPSEEYFHAFLDRLLQCKTKLSWFCYLRPNKLSLETLVKARKAGCVLIRYGVETGSQRILNHMNKKLYVNEIKEIMRNTHDAGIWNHINIVSGYLHETEDDINLTLRFIDDCKEYIDSVRVNPFYIPIGSPIHLHPKKYGITLRKNTGSYLQFDEPENSWEEKQERIKEATGRILLNCMNHKINFAGILPFLVAEAMSHFGDVETTKDWINEKHSYLLEPLSPDTAKWKLAHPERPEVSINRWEEIAGKRGTNYQTLIENDIEQSK